MRPFEVDIRFVRQQLLEMLFQPGKVDSYIEVEHGDNLILFAPEREIRCAISLSRDIDLPRAQHNRIRYLWIG
jgi:hypothetical protein